MEEKSHAVQADVSGQLEGFRIYPGGISCPTFVPIELVLKMVLKNAGVQLGVNGDICNGVVCKQSNKEDSDS